MSAAVQIYSRDFDADFFQLPEQLQKRIENSIDRLGTNLEDFPHRRLSGMETFRIRVGDYRVIYKFDQAAGRLYLVAVGHRREVYRG